MPFTTRGGERTPCAILGKHYEWKQGAGGGLLAANTGSNRVVDLNLVGVTRFVVYRGCRWMRASISCVTSRDAILKLKRMNPQRKEMQKSAHDE